MVLKPREYAILGNTSFYLRDYDLIDGKYSYQITYNTSDQLWDTMELKKVFSIDGFTIHPAGPPFSPSLRILVKPSSFWETIPPGSLLMTLGGGLVDRPFHGTTLSQEAPLSKRSKIGMKTENDSLVLDLFEGDLAFYGGIELKLVQTRINNGYSLVYVLDDGALATKNAASVRCLKGYTKFSMGSSILMKKSISNGNGSFNISLSKIKDPHAILAVQGDGGNRTIHLSCGEHVKIGNDTLSLIWYSPKAMTAKVVIHR